MLSVQQDPTPDLNPDTLGALAALMLAQAQEIFVHKAIHGTSSSYLSYLFDSRTFNFRSNEGIRRGKAGFLLWGFVQWMFKAIPTGQPEEFIWKGVAFNCEF